MRWSLVIVGALLVAGCSAYNELSPDPPITPLERGYIERVIRDGAELERIRRYINENPVRWARR